MGGIWSIPPGFRGVLGVDLVFFVDPESLFFHIASCKLVGLKALNQPLKGSIKPYVKSIISLT
jgi:hypothetical protein